MLADFPQALTDFPDTLMDFPGMLMDFPHALMNFPSGKANNDICMKNSAFGKLDSKYRSTSAQVKTHFLW